MTGGDLVPIDTSSSCPICEGLITEQRHEELALLRHGGYGANRLTIRRVCEACGWSMTPEIGETKP